MNPRPGAVARRRPRPARNPPDSGERWRQMDTRRSFLASVGAAGAGLVVAAFREDALARAAGAGKDAGRTPAVELACDEGYWGQIQRCFDNDRTVINFNNGGV